MTRAALALGLAVAVAAAGCGFGAGEERAGGAELRVTRDFGHEELAADSVERVREDETVMRMLQSRHDVDTRFGGRFVHSIDGLTGGSGETDWFYFVNGLEADRGAGEWELAPGDVVQWDRRDWSAAQRITAVVGAFPEPFRSGIEGKRLPVRLECAETESEACSEARDALTSAGVNASSTQIGATGGAEMARIVVGAWSQLRGLTTAAKLEEEPGTSGIFARFAGEDERLELLDERGEVAREAPAGTGLVAATAYDNQSAVWLVTGLDETGVRRAAAALDEATLRNAFAVAAAPDGVLRLPILSEEERE